MFTEANFRQYYPPELYFLAGIITYMALYGDELPEGYVVPSDVDSRIADRLDTLEADVRAALVDFIDGQGQSRVF